MPAAEQGASLWEYASPNADAIVYINTKQAEKTMTPVLWEKIKKDKEKAIDEDPDERLFDMKNRDLEGIVNVFITPVIPFRISLEGVARISGGVEKDMEKLLANMKNSGGPMPQITKQNDLSVYNLSLNEQIPGQKIDIMAVPLKDGLLQFKINLNQDGETPLQLLSIHSGDTALAAEMAVSDLSFGLACYTAKLAKLPKPPKVNAEMLNKILSDLNSVSLFGRVEGKYLNVTITLHCKTREAAETYKNNSEPMIQQIVQTLPQGKHITGIELRLIENKLSIVGKVDIESAWGLVMQIDRESTVNTPAENTSKDDDDE